MKDFDHSHLTGEAKDIAKIVYEHVKSVLDSEPDGGGCKTFYSPEAWADRGEAYGTESLLVLVHDGGSLAPFCNLDYGAFKLFDGFQEELSKHGYFCELCTGWYSAIYKV